MSTEGIEVADAPGGQSGGARAARLFAVVVITEASNAEQAKDVLQAGLGLGNGYLWVADAAPVGPAAEYELTEIRLSADGEPLVTTPDF